MKDSHWRAVSLSLSTALIVVVASWASAQDDYVGPARANVVVEASRQRYLMRIGHRSAKEVDKYILYDSWNLHETEQIWVLDDPHKAKSKWIRMPFSNKKK